MDAGFRHGEDDGAAAELADVADGDAVPFFSPGDDEIAQGAVRLAPGAVADLAEELACGIEAGKAEQAFHVAWQIALAGGNDDDLLVDVGDLREAAEGESGAFLVLYAIGEGTDAQRILADQQAGDSADEVAGFKVQNVFI